MTENCDDLSTLVEIDDSHENEPVDIEIISGLKIDPKPFHSLSHNVQNCLGEIDKSIFELLELKDKLLLQYLPRSVLLNITLVFSRFFRAYSQIQIPLDELLRLVQLYTQPFNRKCLVFKRIYDSNELHKRMLNVALQKLTSTDHQSKLYEEQKSISHWEKMYIRLATRRSHIRQWKFRIQTFREKANEGYEHVIQWIRTGIIRSSRETTTVSPEEITDNPSEIFDEINEGKSPINQNDKDDNVINESEKHVIEELVEKVDVEIQVQVDFDHQQTSTDDALSTRSLILRIYRPIGIVKTKFRCIIHVHQRKYPTKIFFKSNPRPMTSKRPTKFSKRNPQATTSEKTDVNTIDLEQVDELMIPMANVLKRRSLFETDIDPDAVKIEIFADEQLYGSLILTSEDLRMLDLPTLHNPIFSPFITFEDHLPDEDILRFDQPSNQLYQQWISRLPPTFSILNDQQQTIGKLPLLMFWYEKSENKYATTGTMTEPMEIHLPTAPRTEIFVPTAPIEYIEEMSSDDQIEIIKATYENEISRLHESYQMEIHRLTALLNELPSAPTNVSSSIKTQSRQSHRPFSSYTPFNDPPQTFLDRYEMYLEQSILHRHQLSAKIERDTALANERQMEFQHRLYKPEHDIQFDDDLSLPAVFMPFQSGHVFNPRAYQYFHPVGSTTRRLTQPPSIPKFPALPSRSYSVLNLFELSHSHENLRSTTAKTTQKLD